MPIGANSALKHNSKASGVDWLIVGTWTLAECKAAAWVQEMANWLAFKSVVENRFATVGGLPRYVFTEIRYNKRVEQLALLQPKDLEGLDMSIFDASSNAEYFIAPEPDITSAITGASWKFLCKNAKTPSGNWRNKNLPLPDKQFRTSN